MKKVIYSDTIIRKLQILKNFLAEEYSDKKSDIVLKDIMEKLDNLGIFSSGESVEKRFGIKCDYMYLYIKPNFYFYNEQSEKIEILDMFNEKEDFIFALFNIPMRSQDSIDYWGE